MITKHVKEILDTWFAKRDSHGQILATYERVENLYDIAKIVNGNKKQAGKTILENYDKFVAQPKKIALPRPRNRLILS
jgi:hypothetical protein